MNEREKKCEDGERARGGGEEHKPGERKQERRRRKWVSGGYLRVTGGCHDCTVLWVNCQNIDWSTWQPRHSSLLFPFQVLFVLLLATPPEIDPTLNRLPQGDKTKENTESKLNFVILVLLKIPLKSPLSAVYASRSF